MELQYLASFGDHVPLNQFKPDDTISVLAFSQSGKYLASGDHAGRVVIFQINEPKLSGSKPSVGFVTQIHAHKAVFDYFRSELSEMKVNSIKWIGSDVINPMFLTCNSHDAILWRINQNVKPVWTPLNPTKALEDFVLPTVKQTESKPIAEPLSTFTDLHTEYLVDLQTLNDQKSFLMVDVGCVKLWDIERSVPSVSLYRVPQQQIELTSSAVSNAIPYAFLISDGTGLCHLMDMRQQAEDLTPSMEFNIASHINRQQYVEGSEFISSLAFSSDGINFVARTFGEAQVWDVRKPDCPVSRTDVQWFPGQMEYLSADEYVKDSFRSSFSRSGKVITGNYSADFMSWDWKSGTTSKHRAVSARMPRAPPEPGKDFGKRVTCAEAHPTQPIVAVVSTAALFLFTEKSA